MTGAADEVATLITLARAASASTDAMAELVRRTSPMVWRTCAALVDRASADDLTQETYARAMRSLPSFRGESSPRWWLLTIARRVCADEIAGRQRQRQLQERLRLERRETARDSTALVDVADALDRLGPDRREAFVLTVVTGLSYADAAAVCGVPVGTIRSRVARAREDLARSLSEPPVLAGARA